MQEGRKMCASLAEHSRKQGTARERALRCRTASGSVWDEYDKDKSGRGHSEAAVAEK